MDKLEKGFYDCGSKIHKCMSFEDYKRHALNDERLYESQQWLLHALDDVNGKK